MISSSVILESPNLHFVPFHKDFLEPITNAFGSADVNQFLAYSSSQIQTFIDSLKTVSYFPDVNHNMFAELNSNENYISHLIDNNFELPIKKITKIKLPESAELVNPWNQFQFSDCNKPIKNPSINTSKNTQLPTHPIHKNFTIPNEIWWCLIEKKSNQFVGMAGLIDISTQNKKAECAVWLLPNFRGKGYLTDGLYGLCTYGFHFLDFHRIDVYIVADNLSCKRSLEKTPFLYEGYLQDFEFMDNKFYSYHLYSMINPLHFLQLN